MLNYVNTSRTFYFASFYNYLWLLLFSELLIMFFKEAYLINCVLLVVGYSAAMMTFPLFESGKQL